MRSSLTSVLSVCIAATLLAAAGPVLAATTIERTLALAPGGRLVVDTEVGTVRVVGGARTDARVVITSRSDDIENLYDFTFKDVGGEVVIEAVRKGSTISRWFSWSSGGGLMFDIEVPRDTEVLIDTSGGGIEVDGVRGPLHLDTSGGGIAARNIGGNVTVDTSGGGIDVESVDGDVFADTSGGGIEISRVRGSVRADTSGGGILIREVAGEIEADTSGGGIRIEDAHGSVRAATSGGPVEVSFAAGNAAGGTLSTSGGGVDVWLDAAVALDIDASSSAGSVKSDLSVAHEGRASKSSLRGKLNGGGNVLKLRASGGGVRIHER